MSRYGVQAWIKFYLLPAAKGVFGSVLTYSQ